MEAIVFTITLIIRCMETVLIPKDIAVDLNSLARPNHKIASPTLPLQLTAQLTQRRVI